jgi:hypothetical protein
VACGVSRDWNSRIRRCGTPPCARGGRDGRRDGRAAGALAPCDNERAVYFVGASHTVERAQSISEYAMARQVTDHAGPACRREILVGPRGGRKEHGSNCASRPS